MAFSRKFLSALGIEADKVDQIIDAHTEVTDALKAERDKYKADAEKLPGVQAELEGLKTEKEKNGKDPFKVKYEALKEEFENFKKDQTAKESKAAKAEAFRALLKECGVAEKRIDAVLKVSDIDGLELDEAGKLKNAADLKKDVKSEWADFIVTHSTKGVDTPNPPSNSGGSLSREDIYKRDDNGRFLLDASQRQAALAQINAAEQQKG